VVSSNAATVPSQSRISLALDAGCNAYHRPCKRKLSARSPR
jgi:hypothetical protein